MTVAETALAPAAGAGTTSPRRRRGNRGPDDTGARPLDGWSGAGLGVAVLWLSLLVLLPLAAVVVKAGGLGLSGFWDAITNDDAVQTVLLTLAAAAIVTLVNAVFGLIIAWVLARDSFPGRRIVEVIIDIPFALPTIVAGLVMLSLYGPMSPVHINLYATKPGVVVSLLFVTLPFVVRTVQPVLEVLDRDAEQAARSLGAGGFVVFRRVVLPAIMPALVSGMALAFARAIGEYGSMILISGGLPGTTVASMYIYNQIQVDRLGNAAAVSTELLVIAVVVILVMTSLQRWVARRA